MIRCPQLVFHTLKAMNKGSLAYVDSMSAGDVADDLIDLQRDDNDHHHNDDNDDASYSMFAKIYRVEY